MELILFIILCGYLLIRVAADKGASANAKKNHAIRQAAEAEWRSNVTDQKLEAELKLFIERPENRDKVQEEVADVYDLVLDGRRIDELYPRELWCKRKKDWTYEYHEHVQELICRYNTKNAMRIMMAKRGYIPYLDTLSTLTEVSKLDVEVLIWCEKELSRHGTPAFLCAENQGGSFSKISQSDYGMYGSMRIVWRMKETSRYTPCGYQ